MRRPIAGTIVGKNNATSSIVPVWDTVTSVHHSVAHPVGDSGTAVLEDSDTPVLEEAIHCHYQLHENDDNGNDTCRHLFSVDPSLDRRSIIATYDHMIVSTRTVQAELIQETTSYYNCSHPCENGLFS